MNKWGITDVGCSRSENQDSYFITELDNGDVLAVVCDGMGGAKAGNVASALAVQAFEEISECEEFRSYDREQFLLAGGRFGNEAVYLRSREDAACKGMGTTLVGVRANVDEAVVINEGDSCAFLITADECKKITKDHSFVQELVDMGKLAPEKALTHPQKNLITRALGIENKLNADVFHVDWKPGDCILLCSDGLSNIVSEQEMLFELNMVDDRTDCCNRLLEIALKQGAPDNVTVVIVENSGKEDAE